MCSGVLIDSFLDVLEVEAGFEGVQDWAAEQGEGVGGWLARHGTSIRWARLIARMFGHGHRAMCSGGCQFEVLEERVLARYVPAHKTDEADTESVGECK